MKAEADRAVIIVKYEDKSKTALELLTVELSGNAHWQSDGIDVFADGLTLSFRPSIRANEIASHPIDWTLRGRARLKGRNFAADADQIELKSCYMKGFPKQSAIRITLEGHAVLRNTGKSNGGKMHASRMELRPDHGAVPSPAERTVYDGRKATVQADAAYAHISRNDKNAARSSGHLRTAAMPGIRDGILWY